MNHAEELLKYSKIHDIEKTFQILSLDQIKQDVSVFSRLLINAYCGWPFLDAAIKKEVLVGLSNIIAFGEDLPIYNFEARLAETIKPIVDKHLQVGQYKYKTKRHFVNVGNNLAHGRGKYKFSKTDNNIAIAAISSFAIRQKDEIKRFINGFKEIIDNSSALIIDLRGNSGGNNTAIKQVITDYLYGADTPSSVKVWIRGTDEARIIYKKDPNYLGLLEKCDGTDPVLIYDNPKKNYPKFESNKPGYKKPIYILTDQKTESAAEMTCTNLLHHPTVIRIGDNTSGCEENGNQTITTLPNSKIQFRFGVNHRELEIKDFEDHGYPPDIRCINGQDAYATALEEFKNKKYSYA
jgi:hypothetical protein